LNDSEQAEAVVNGLAENWNFWCSCGDVHRVSPPSDSPTIVQEEVAFVCDCGLEWIGSRHYNRAHRLAYWVWNPRE
jgi:hypothetical protein